MAKKKKILIVDDNDDVLRGLRVLFRAHNYTTVAAGDAVTAISQAKSEKPDLIVLDLGLPAGDGYLVMERMSNIDELASIPVIVFTARDDETHRARALEAGAKAFFQKPVDPADLLSSVKQILSGRNSNQPSLVPMETVRPT
ncbi:MAG TPA: response regulator [Candidatus Binatia bacterium]|nr:response regulator [Candidatus Binatia bacterium]